MPRIEALDADRQAVHAGGAVRRELRRFERAGIGFERDLGVGRERHARAHGRQDRVDRLGAQHARRAAAEENRVDAPAPDERQRLVEIRDERIDVGSLRGFRRALRAN